ncbi:BREX system P-loop protein BrxC [Aliarcobacter butzleri]|uniref:BREX system P-loop protein BrxC n=1 Tax=Aliarcobacter butzleri TaxID=28197 RepID=UPI00263D1672|nr:BREX system P-loop protein BrxC [Aliarcobacter butzleri]MDN5081974.1 BREX system P-loop protein BrxC [Aliarcobacter butzleri]MDN5084284.1 BREX system P-loop protein BrxC [Aliarcobacter butzleri]
MIKNIFKKDINRNIAGVIMADNTTDEAVFQEVDEYVITNDLSKKLDEFFEVYSSTIGKPTENIGVWISGFFGSGKSHLLKILSYILSNQRIHSDLIGELFIQKIGQDDFELKNNIQKALKVPAHSILFNIDQKAENSGKNSDDAILAVFMKVFNEMRGYYPKFGYIAKFESDLDKQGLFEDFKVKFKEKSGESWETGRETIHLEIDSVASALSEIKGISIENASETIDKYEENYSLSIEEFANEVKDYINKQEPNYRLIFCVDEVGQFIGDNIKLMLNLQTIVETLSTRCKGQAWVIVTSQSAVSDLVANQKSKEFDFSKIIARFKVKLNLTSQNANEVIQKRLLAKKDESYLDLVTLYVKVQNSLKSIIHFTDREKRYKSYSNSDDFASIYPFIPYQMDLFQSCIIGLSRNSAFQGKHQSIGERSMLDVVQNVTKKVSDESIGTIATFDKFFDGLSSTIRGELQSQINQAINSLGENSLEVKILKILFMVKYVKEFNANIDNIITLLVNSVDCDISDLKKKVSNSLFVLIENVFIQKIGDIYEYLTDVEKDIENEIKEISIEQREVTANLVKWIYDDILKTNKVRFDFNKQDYLFARKMDDILVKSKDEELSLNIITPLVSHDYTSERLFGKSIGDRDIIVYLEPNFDFIKDLDLYVKTEKFIPQKRNGNLTDTENSLLFNKASDNNKRRDKLQEDLKEMFINSSIYFNGKILDIKSSDPKILVDKAFNEAIPVIYPNITMLNKIYNETDIKTILMQSDDLLTGSDDALNEAENEIFNYLKRQKASHQNITISKILEQYSIKPFGWYQSAILCLLASMYMKKRVDLKKNTHLLNKSEILTILSNNREYSNTIVAIVEKVDDKDIKVAKDILKEFFPNGNFTSTSAREIIDLANKEYEETLRKLNLFLSHSYPFKDSFKTAISKIKVFEKLDYDNFFSDIKKYEDELLDLKEELLDSLFEFMEGDKRKIYDEISSFISSNKDNLYHIKDERINDLYALINDLQPFKGNKIQTAKASLKAIEEQLNPMIENVKKQALIKIDELITQIQSLDLFSKIQGDKSSVIKPILNIKSNIEGSNNIDFINQRVSTESLKKEFEDSKERILELLPKDEQEQIPKKPKTRFEQIKPKNRYSLETVDDVEEFINELKSKMINEVNNGREITL